MTNSNFLMHNHSKTWIVLPLWYWLATKGHITYPLAHPLKNILHRNKHCCLLVNISRLTHLDVHCNDSLIVSNNCASVYSAVSSIHLLMVLAKRGTDVIFWIADSPKSSRQMSLAAGRIDSSSTVKGFLALVMWLDTKNDALNEETFDKVAAFNNCFCSSCSH